MKALGATFALLLCAAASSAQVAQVGPPTSPGTPRSYPYPGQRYPGGGPPDIGQPRVTTRQAPDTAGQQSSSDLTPDAAQEVTGEVASIDAKAGTITVRQARAGMEMSDTAGPAAELTLRVDSRARSSLEKLHAGDEVRLVCRTDRRGSHVVEEIERIAGRRPTELPANP